MNWMTFMGVVEYRDFPGQEHLSKVKKLRGWAIKWYDSIFLDKIKSNQNNRTLARGIKDQSWLVHTIVKSILY